MCYDDEYFYDDPFENVGELQEFDEFVTSYKNKLRDNIKEDFINKMEALEKENKELREFKEQRDKIENDYKQKMRELDLKIARTQEEVRRERIGSLMQTIKEKYWFISRKTIYAKDKCDKCDDSRYIHFTSPSGKDYKECCECDVTMYGFYAKEMVIYCIRENWSYSTKTDLIFVNENEYTKDRDSYYRSFDTRQYREDLKDLPNEKIKEMLTQHDPEHCNSNGRYEYDVFLFTTKEKCEEACEFFNQIEIEKKQKEGKK